MSTLGHSASFIPDPHGRIPISLAAFASNILPHYLCFYGTALLALRPNTFIIRLAVLPITLWTAFRLVKTYDFTLETNAPELRWMNVGFCLSEIALAMRVISLTASRVPYRRISAPDINTQPTSNENGHVYGLKPDEPSESVPPLQTSMREALDLMINFRELGWEASHGLRLPPETRPQNRLGFITYTLISFFGNWLFQDSILLMLRECYPDSIGSRAGRGGGSIFDNSLPPLSRYTHSTFITLSILFWIYAGVNAVYDFATLIGLIIYRQEPAQWPPVFDKPWLSTSIAEFWAKRWHQIFRVCFINLGARPLSNLFHSRALGILGTFFVSAILHDWSMWGMGFGTDFMRAGGPLLMSGVGIILESTWKKITGKKVGGLLGWVWMITWTIVWCHFIVDEWAKRGLVLILFVPERWRPSVHLASLLLHREYL